MSILRRKSAADMRVNLVCVNTMNVIKNLVSYERWIRMPAIGLGRLTRHGIDLNSVNALLENGIAQLSDIDVSVEPIPSRRMSCKVNGYYGTVVIGHEEVMHYIKTGELSLLFTSGMMLGAVKVSDAEIHEYSKRSILDAIGKAKLVFDLDKINGLV